MKSSKAWQLCGALIASVGLASLMAHSEATQVKEATWAAAPERAGTPPILLDYIPKDPLVIYNLSGATLLGEVHQQLTVYSDGTATCSEIDPMGNPAGSAQRKALPVSALQWLLDELILYRAHVLDDDTNFAFDVPLATVTMMFKQRNGTTVGHSFSYYPVVAGEEAAKVEGIVRAFIAEHFAAEGGGWSEADHVKR